MIDKITHFLTEPGAAKTPILGVGGWVTWSALKGVMQDVVVVLTFVIMVMHAWNYLAKQFFCKKRLSGQCGKCWLKGCAFCPNGTKDEE